MGKTSLARTLVAILGSLFLAVTCGCGGGPDLPPMAEVSGRVTLDGKPLTVGFVQFVPDDAKGTAGPPGVGAIDAEGRYQLTTAGVEGAIVGFHKVRVESSQPAKSDMDPPGPSLIPQRYNNPATSGLAKEVKGGQDNEINLELTSGP